MAPAGDHNKPAGALLCPRFVKQGHFHSEPSEPSQPPLPRSYRYPTGDADNASCPPRRTDRKAWETALCREPKYSCRGGSGMTGPCYSSRAPVSDGSAGR